MAILFLQLEGRSPSLLAATLAFCSLNTSTAFLLGKPSPPSSVIDSWTGPGGAGVRGTNDRTQFSTTALPVWWFGGTGEQEAIDEDSDSCELVAVRIDRTSANSRRISGDIVVPTPLIDVWSILTDYDRLSIHVPNLVESKIMSSNSQGCQGDGSYTCRLYQKGAQKIVGFQFGADVTMEMKEAILTASESEERSIGFKCVDSLFFSEFDGEWLVQDIGADFDGTPQTKISYQVDVRPKGPVPVGALEWRIREDVPTNLRAVKRAALLLAGNRQLVGANDQSKAEEKRMQSVRVNWLEDETMAAYLKQQ